MRLTPCVQMGFKPKTLSNLPEGCQVVLMLHVVKQLQSDLPFTMAATGSNGTAIHDDVGHLGFAEINTTSS